MPPAPLKLRRMVLYNFDYYYYFIYLFVYLIRQMAANSKIHNEHKSQ